MAKYRIEIMKLKNGKLGYAPQVKGGLWPFWRLLGSDWEWSIYPTEAAARGRIAEEQNGERKQRHFIYV